MAAATELVPGRTYRFLFEPSHGMYYSTHPILGPNQNFMPELPPEYGYTGTVELKGTFILEIHNVYAFYVIRLLNSNNNQPLKFDRRIVFTNANPTMILGEVQEPPMSQERLNELQTFIIKDLGSEIIPGSNIKISSVQIARSLLRKKVATQKLKPFINQWLHMPPETFDTPNDQPAVRMSGGPYYKRAAESWAKGVHGSARRRRNRSRRNRRKTRRL